MHNVADKGGGGDPLKVLQQRKGLKGSFLTVYLTNPFLFLLNYITF